MIRLITIVALATFLLAGCNKTPSETSKDVAKAREVATQDSNAAREDASKTENKANENVADAQDVYAESKAGAQEKLSAAESKAMIAKAKADFDVALTDAEGRHSIAIEKCGSLKGVDKTACVSTADAKLASDQADATAERDSALMDAEHHE